MRIRRHHTKWDPVLQDSISSQLYLRFSPYILQFHKFVLIDFQGLETWLHLFDNMFIQRAVTYCQGTWSYTNTSFAVDSYKFVDITFRAFTILTKSGFRDAPPTRKPSTSAWAARVVQFPAFTEPCVCMCVLCTCVCMCVCVYVHKGVKNGM